MRQDKLGSSPCRAVPFSPRMVRRRADSLAGQRINQKNGEGLKTHLAAAALLALSGSIALAQARPAKPGKNIISGKAMKDRQTTAAAATLHLMQTADFSAGEKPSTNREKDQTGNSGGEGGYAEQPGHQRIVSPAGP